VVVVWQAVLGGLSGYPEPWLPVGERGAWWLLALTAATQALVLPALWRLNGGDRLLPRSRPAQQAVLWGLMGLAALVPWLRWDTLALVAQSLQLTFILGCLLSLAAGMRAWLRGDCWALAGLAALVPLLVMIAADASSAGGLLGVPGGSTAAVGDLAADDGRLCHEPAVGPAAPAAR